MIKVIGLVIIILASTKIGFDFSDRYIKRTKSLKIFSNALEIMCKEISFTSSALSDIFETTAISYPKELRSLFSDMAAYIKRENITPIDAFANCYDNSKFMLNNDDLRVLTDFFSNCGSGATDDEIKNINNAVNYLNYNLKNAINNENKYVKLYRFTGLIAGVILGIIFI